MHQLFRVVVLFSFTLIFTFAALPQAFSDKTLSLKAVNYKLDIRFDFDKKKLFGKCTIQLNNPSDKAIKTVPLLLYRLLKVDSIKDEKGNPVRFTQQVLTFEDWSLYQANYIEVVTDEPIKSGEKKTLTVEYSGHLLGYAETGMLYIKDKIDPNFTIIRPDSLGYPELGYPSFGVNRAAGLAEFDYEINVTVPEEITVANGGKLVAKTSENGLSTYKYRNIKPAWRIDIAIAKYNILTSGNFKLYHFPEDIDGANRIMKSAKETFALYSKWWGQLKNHESFSVIEIPSNLGSQADVTSILQTADAFKDDDKTGQLYHEISHIWNVEPKEKASPRWNEGLAMFVMYLTVEKLENRRILENSTVRTLNLIRKKLKESDKLASTPMINYGKEGITGNSYTVGMLMFRVLYDLVGEEKFNRIIGSFYQNHYKAGATTNDFVKLAKKISNVDLNKFFDDWMFTTNYTKFIEKGDSINTIVATYK